MAQYKTEDKYLYQWSQGSRIVVPNEYKECDTLFFSATYDGRDASHQHFSVSHNDYTLENGTVYCPIPNAMCEKMEDIIVYAYRVKTNVAILASRSVVKVWSANKPQNWQSLPTVDTRTLVMSLEMLEAAWSNPSALAVESDSPFVSVVFDDEGISFTFGIVKGEDGEDGTDGVGIVSILKTSSEGLVDTYTITMTDGSTTQFTVTNGASGSGVSWEQIDNKPSVFPPSTHTHDDRYYTEAETDAKLSAKANASDVYSKAEVDSKLISKFNAEYGISTLAEMRNAYASGRPIILTVDDEDEGEIFDIPLTYYVDAVEGFHFVREKRGDFIDYVISNEDGEWSKSINSIPSDAHINALIDAKVGVLDALADEIGGLI